jgi:hypothetical protein
MVRMNNFNPLSSRKSFRIESAKPDAMVWEQTL